ncbi:hypothetical protein EK21DRAFT_84034 [Setomelanomma holmii]|uniref:Uncharacterized protein n=1 Tax=Setomelanomma holmii TaxID=210430 RepID=A0A9P4HMM5_9PLEO|nr:hypothetical protein EK21DRAFT_84034 [Setomelanomma holmii]
MSQRSRLEALEQDHKDLSVIVQQCINTPNNTQNTSRQSIEDIPNRAEKQQKLIQDEQSRLEGARSKSETCQSAFTARTEWLAKDGERLRELEDRCVEQNEESATATVTISHMQTRHGQEKLEMQQGFDQQMSDRAKESEQRLHAMEEIIEQRLSVMEKTYDQRLSVMEMNFEKRLSAVESNFEQRLFAIEMNTEKQLSAVKSKAEQQFSAIKAKYETSLERKQTQDMDKKEYIKRITNRCRDVGVIVATSGPTATLNGECVPGSPAYHEPPIQFDYHHVDPQLILFETLDLVSRQAYADHSNWTSRLDELEHLRERDAVEVSEVRSFTTESSQNCTKSITKLCKDLESQVEARLATVQDESRSSIQACTDWGCKQDEWLSKIQKEIVDARYGVNHVDDKMTKHIEQGRQLLEIMIRRIHDIGSAQVPTPFGTRLSQQGTNEVHPLQAITDRMVAIESAMEAYRADTLKCSKAAAAIKTLRFDVDTLDLHR